MVEFWWSLYFNPALLRIAIRPPVGLGEIKYLINSISIRLRV